MEVVDIPVPDGGTVPLRLMAAQRRAGVVPDRPPTVVFVVPGLAVPGQYYEDFARELAARGCDVAVGELRGNGTEQPAPTAASAYGYQELVAVDFPAMLQVVRSRFPASTPVLLGHSLGGQLAMMYAARVRGRLGGLILVASGTPHYRAYRGLAGLALLVGATAAAVASELLGVWPGDRIPVGGFGRQSKVLVSDWARLARTGRFAPAGADMDYEQRMARLELPVLSITVAGDPVTPRGSAARLLQKLPRAHIQRWHQPQPLGHNGWVLDCESTVDRIETWLAHTVSAPETG